MFSPHGGPLGIPDDELAALDPLGVISRFNLGAWTRASILRDHAERLLHVKVFWTTNGAQSAAARSWVLESGGRLLKRWAGPDWSVVVTGSPPIAAAGEP